MNSECIRGKERSRRVVHAFIASAGVKIISVISMFLSVSMVSGALGKEEFGFWMLITSIVGAMQFADLGVGNCLINMIAVANARNDQAYACQAVSNCIGILLMLGILILMVFGMVYSFIDWGAVFNLSTASLAENAGVSTAVMVMCVAISLPLMTSQRVQMGYQEGFKANIWISIGILLSLAGVVVCRQMEAGLIAFVTTALGGPVVASALCWIYEFIVVRSWLFPNCKYLNIETGGRVFKEGAVWTWFQLMAFVGTAADNIIITCFFGPEEVTKYSIMSKLLTGLLVAQLLTAPLWPAFSEAIERGDLVWARYTFKRSMILCACIGFVGAGVIILLSPLLIEWWVGREFVPDMTLICGFALWCFVTNFFAGISAMMANRKLLPSLVRLTSIAALFSFVLKIFITQKAGPNFVIWATVISYGLMCPLGFWLIRCLINTEIKAVNTVSNMGVLQGE